MVDAKSDSVSLPYRGHKKKLQDKCQYPDKNETRSNCTPDHLKLNPYSVTPTRTPDSKIPIMFNKYRRVGNDSANETARDYSKLNTMGAEGSHYTPMLYVTAFFGAAFFLGGVAVTRSRHKGLIRACLAMSAVCMWLFWFMIYVGQMNPLIGPRLKNTTLAWMAYKIGDPVQGRERPSSQISEL